MYRIVGKGWVTKRRGHWQLNIKLVDENGNMTSRSSMTDIKCESSSNRGRPAALELLPTFRMKIAQQFGVAESATSTWVGSDVVQSIRNYIDYLYTAKRIEAQTAEGYEYSLKHIARGFKGIDVAEVSPSLIMTWLMKSFEEGHSANVMKRAMRLLSQYYRFLLSFPDPPVNGNPCDAVPCPQPHEAAPNPLRRDQIIRLNRAVNDLPDGFLRRASVIALYTGLRAGEACALLWSDIDWDRKEILVSRSVARKRGGGLLVKETKGRERRVIPLCPVLSRELRSWRDTDLEEGRRLGLSITPSALDEVSVLTSWDIGRAPWTLNPNRLSKSFSSFSQAHQLMGITGDTVTFHGLRHTFATQWIANGGDIAALSSVLGHKDAGFTLQVYVSTDPLARRSGILFAAATLAEGWGADVASDGQELVDVHVQVPLHIANLLKSVAVRRGVAPSVLAGEMLGSGLEGMKRHETASESCWPGPTGIEERHLATSYV